MFCDITFREQMLFHAGKCNTHTCQLALHCRFSLGHRAPKVPFLIGPYSATSNNEPESQEHVFSKNLIPKREVDNPACGASLNNEKRSKSGKHRQQLHCKKMKRIMRHDTQHCVGAWPECPDPKEATTLGQVMASRNTDRKQETWRSRNVADSKERVP